MDWKDWNGKKIFVRLKTGKVYSGNVIDVDDSAQYFQYRAWLETDDTDYTPYLEWVNVTYGIYTDSEGNYNASITAPATDFPLCSISFFSAYALIFFLFIILFFYLINICMPRNNIIC